MEQERLKRLAIEFGGVAFFCLLMLVIAYFIHPSEKWMGILQMESYQYGESEDRLIESYQENPEDIVTLKSLSRLYKILGNPYKEIRFLNEYLQLKPYDTEMRKELAKVYLWNLKESKAKEQFEFILTYDSENIDVLRKLAASYTWQQNHKKAIECFNKVSSLGEMTDEDYRSLVQLYVNISDLESALVFSKEQRLKFRKTFGAPDYRKMADLYLWLGNRSNALGIMEKMLRHYPRSIDIKSTCIDWLAQAGEQKVAVKKLNQWLQDMPDNMELLESLVDIYLNLEKPKEALVIFNKILTHSDVEERHQVQYFWLLVDLGKYKEAYEKGVRFNDKIKNDENLWELLANYAFKLKKYSDSEFLYLMALKKDPQSETAHQYLYYINKQFKKDNEAFRYLSWLLKRDPDNVEYIMAALDYYTYKKNFLEAFHWATHGLAVESQNKYFAEVVVQAARELEKWEVAFKQLTELSEQYPDEFSYGMTLIGLVIKLNKPEVGKEILDELWKRFNKDAEKAEKIADMSGWLGFYDNKFERYVNLENREQGYQYKEICLKSAMDAKRYDYAFPLLLKDYQEHDKIPKKYFKWLISLFQYLNIPKQELEFYSKNKIFNYLNKKTVLVRKTELYLNLGYIKESILTLVELYDNHGKKKKWFEDIIEQTMWLDDKEFQLSIFKKYHLQSDEVAIYFAELLTGKSDWLEARKFLEMLSVSGKDNLKRHELLLGCMYQLKDDEGVHKQLNALIELTHSKIKKSSYLAQRASILHQKGDIKATYQDSLQALKYNPENKQAMVMNGYALYDLKRYPEAAIILKRSESMQLYDRFLIGASLIRFPQGYREGVRVFHALLDEYRGIQTKKKWNLVLDIGYELNSPFYIERAWHHLIQSFNSEELMYRYALHLSYTDRKIEAEKVYKQLKPVDTPNYLALQKLFNPELQKGNLSENEKLALADASNRSGSWFQASNWLP